MHMQGQNFRLWQRHFVIPPSSASGSRSAVVWREVLSLLRVHGTCNSAAKSPLGYQHFPQLSGGQDARSSTAG